MLTEMQSVVAGMRKHSCGDVAAYTAVCCFSDVGVVIGSGWKADEENLDYTGVDQDSQQPKGKFDSAEFAKKGLKLATKVVKSANALAKDSVRRMSSSDSGSEPARRRSRSSSISEIYAVPGRLYA